MGMGWVKTQASAFVRTRQLNGGFFLKLAPGLDSERGQVIDFVPF